MKYFITSDVHGFYDLWRKALKNKGFEENNPDHCLINLGDLFDRGEQNYDCLNWIMSLKNKILIRGNHEDLLEELLRGRHIQPYDYSNGTAATIMELSGIKTTWFDDSLEIVQRSELLWEYLNSCKDYAEIGDNIFVHGWIPTFEDWREEASKWDWRDARWLNGMNEWLLGNREEGKTIYCGHWHVTWARYIIDQTCKSDFPEYDPRKDLTDPNYNTRDEIDKLDWSTWKNDGIVALDGCTALSGIVNCEVLEV